MICFALWRARSVAGVLLALNCLRIVPKMKNIAAINGV